MIEFWTAIALVFTFVLFMRAITGISSSKPHPVPKSLRQFKQWLVESGFEKTQADFLVRFHKALGVEYEEDLEDLTKRDFMMIGNCTPIFAQRLECAIQNAYRNRYQYRNRY